MTNQLSFFRKHPLYSLIEYRVLSRSATLIVVHCLLQVNDDTAIKYRVSSHCEIDFVQNLVQLTNQCPYVSYDLMQAELTEFTAGRQSVNSNPLRFVNF